MIQGISNLERLRLSRLSNPTVRSNDLLGLDFVSSLLTHLSSSSYKFSNLISDFRTGLPGVIAGFPETSSVPITDIFFWTPQVIGGTGFIVASTLLMLEEQKAWYKLNLRSLGWYVQFKFYDADAVS